MKPLISKLYRDKILQIVNLYREIEHNTRMLSLNSDIKCVKGCGECCINEKIEASPIEFYPMAYHIWAIKMGERFLEKLDKNKEEKICALFSHENYSFNKWACTMHTLRPLICRLFGFYAMKNKQGNIVFSGCKTIKEYFPEEHNKAGKFITDIMPHMCMHNYYMKVSMIGNDSENKLMPINFALKTALEAIGFEICKGCWIGNFPKILR